jgi:hypothetical protein
MRFLAARYGWGEVRKSRERPLWEPTTDHRPTTTDQRSTENSRLRTPNPEPRTPNPELRIQDYGLTAIAEALTRLGATEDDVPLLEGAARAAAELFGTQRINSR